MQHRLSVYVDFYFYLWSIKNSSSQDQIPAYRFMYCAKNKNVFFYLK